MEIKYIKYAVIVGFIVVICFLLVIFTNPFGMATLRINTWSPEIRSFIEDETGISFPVDEKPVYFKFVEFQDYQIKIVFFISKSEIVSMFPKGVFEEFKQGNFSRDFGKENFILSDKDVSDNISLNSLIHAAKCILFTEEYYSLERLEGKPILLDVEIYLPDAWENVEESEKVLLVMGIFET